MSAGLTNKSGLAVAAFDLVYCSLSVVRFVFVLHDWQNTNERLEMVTSTITLLNTIILQTNHRIDWDSAECVIYSTDYYQQLTLESWFTNLEQTPLNRCQQLPAPYKRLINDTKTDKQ